MINKITYCIIIKKKRKGDRCEEQTLVFGRATGMTTSLHKNMTESLVINTDSKTYLSQGEQNCKQA